MGIRRYCCTSPVCSHTKYFCQSCKSKGCNACSVKATEQWIAPQQHILPDCEWLHITFTMPDKLWSAFTNNWPILNQLFACAANTLLKWAKKLSIEIGLFVTLHTYGRQLNSHPHIHLSVTCEGLCLKHGIWRPIFFKKRSLSVTGVKLSLLYYGEITPHLTYWLRAIHIFVTIANGANFLRLSASAAGKFK
ncbi:transposase zinc-binding domain-containing protein [Providencia sp. SP181]